MNAKTLGPLRRKAGTHWRQKHGDGAIWKSDADKVAEMVAQIRSGVLRFSDPACDLTVLWAYYCAYKEEAERPPSAAADPRSTVPSGATLLAAPKARRQRLLLYLCAMWPQYS